MSLVSVEGKDVEVSLPHETRINEENERREEEKGRRMRKRTIFPRILRIESSIPAKVT